MYAGCIMGCIMGWMWRCHHNLFKECSTVVLVTTWFIAYVYKLHTTFQMVHTYNCILCYICRWLCVCCSLPSDCNLVVKEVNIVTYVHTYVKICYNDFYDVI